MKRPVIGVTQDIEPRKNGGWRTYVDKSYQDAVYRHGGMPLLLPVLDDTGAAAEIVKTVDGLFFTGGEDIHPRYFGEEIKTPMELSPDIRTEFEFALLKAAIAADLPVLAVCLGIQALNIHLGGTIHQDMSGHRRKGRILYHDAEVMGESLLARILRADSIRVNSTHHQSVNLPGRGLKVSAAAPDGVVEAVELPGKRFVLGLQWHPEKLPDDPASVKIFKAFIKACKQKIAKPTFLIVKP